MKANLNKEQVTDLSQRIVFWCEDLQKCDRLITDCLSDLPKREKKFFGLWSKGPEYTDKHRYAGHCVYYNMVKNRLANLDTLENKLQACLAETVILEDVELQIIVDTLSFIHKTFEVLGEK